MQKITTITQFDRKSAKIVQDAAVEALVAVAAKFGLTVEPDSGTLGGNTAVLKFKFNAVVTAADKKRMKQDFSDNVWRCKPAKASWYGKKFENRGHMYEIVGLSPKRKNQIETKRDDGKIYMWPAELLDQVLKTTL